MIRLTAAAVLLLAAACSSEASEPRMLTARDGEVASEATWAARFEAVLDEQGYSTVCIQGLRLMRADVAAGDLGQSPRDEYERMIEVYTAICDDRAQG